MAELSEIRAGIAASLATLRETGIEVIEDDDPVKFQVLPYSNPNPSPQSIIITRIEEVDYSTAFRGEDVDFVVVIEAYVSDTHDESAYRILDKLLMGENSVRQLLGVTPGFGITGLSSRVQSQSGHKVFNLVNTKVLGADWGVRIIHTD